MFQIPRPMRFLFPALALILLQPGAAIYAQDPRHDRSATPEAKFKIAGTIVSSITGMPLENARVSLIDTENSKNTMSMVTAEGGHFVFDSLKPGKFSLQGAKRGYISAAYEQHEQFSTAIVTGAGLDTENLVLRLTPLALLGGKIADEAGDPVRHATVRLFVEYDGADIKQIAARGGTSTDDQGTFEFTGLTPGNYFLSVEARPWYAVNPVSLAAEPAGTAPRSVPSSLDVTYPTTYYGGATEADNATPIAIKGGDHSQVEIHLSPVPTLHLVYHIPVNGEQSYATPVLQKRVFDTVEYVQTNGSQCANPPGVCEMTGVPAGRYSVRLQDSKTGQVQQSSDVNLFKDGQELDTSQGEQAAKVKISVKMPRDEPFPKQMYVALVDSRQQIAAYLQVDAAGEATFENLVAGKYTIRVDSPTKRYSVARTWFQGVEAPGHILDVKPGSTLDATVSLIDGVVTIEGFARKREKPIAGVMVVLVPNDPEAHLDMFRRDQSDFDGSFVLREAIPGSYTLIAVEDAWGFQWLQPGVLKRYVEHGQALTIGELMRGSVHLPDPIEVQPR